VLHIRERPGRVAALCDLPAPVLGKLIDHVGLADAGELVALASTEQLAEVFDQDLGRAPAPGVDERFQAARLALWLQGPGESGEAFLVERWRWPERRIRRSSAIRSRARTSATSRPPSCSRWSRARPVGRSCRPSRSRCRCAPPRGTGRSGSRS
jgi:hypothetical protein